MEREGRTEWGANTVGRPEEKKKSVAGHKEREREKKSTT